MLSDKDGSKAILEFDLQFVLPILGKLRAVLRDIKNVRRGPAFCVDQADLDIEAFLGKRGTDVIQQAGPVERHDFDDGAVRGTFVVHVDSRFHTHLGRPLLRLKFPFHERGDVQFTGDRGDQLLLQADDFRWIVIERLEPVRKSQRVQDNAIPVCAGIGLQDVHAPGRNRAGHLRKKKRAVFGNQDEFIILVALGDADFRNGMPEPAVHPVVSGNLR